MPSYKTALGQSLGSLLQSGASSRNDGYAKGMQANAYAANAEESLAKAAKTAAEEKLLARQAELGSDAGIRNIAEISSGTDNDLARMIEQNLRRENVPLDSLPTENEFYPGYKGAKQNERALMAQLMAGLGAGDRSVDLQKTIKGVTENVINGRLRDPQANVGAIANALSAFGGKGQDTQQGIAIQRVNETPGIDPIVAALAALGKDALGERENDKMQSKDRRYNTDVDASTSRYRTNVGASTSRANNADTIRGAMQRHTTPGANRPKAKEMSSAELDEINSVELDAPIVPQVPLDSPDYRQFASIHKRAAAAGDLKTLRILLHRAEKNGLIRRN